MAMPPKITYASHALGPALLKHNTLSKRISEEGITMKRRPVWNRRLVRLLIGSVALILSMEVAVPSSADTNPAQPSLKELVQKRSKVNQLGDAQLSESPASSVPDDELNRGVPRSSVGNFLAAANKRDYARAAEYLDLHNLPLGMTESQGPELARQL